MLGNWQEGMSDSEFKVSNRDKFKLCPERVRRTVALELLCSKEDGFKLDEFCLALKYALEMAIPLHRHIELKEKGELFEGYGRQLSFLSG
jgi:hypothetical protein